MTHDFYIPNGREDARGGRETSISYVTFHPCSGSPEHATHSPQRPQPRRIENGIDYSFFPRARRAFMLVLCRLQ